VKYIGINKKVTIMCDKHGTFSQEAKAHLRGQGCPTCGNEARKGFRISEGEQAIIQFLQERQIKFITQKSFNDCKYKGLLRYDFFIPDRNMLIEYDGEQHFKYIPFFHETIQGFEEQQIKDEIKNCYAKDNNICLLRIKHNDDILLKLREKI
jgi:very-short-patch-repair endonuclease